MMIQGDADNSPRIAGRAGPHAFPLVGREEELGKLEGLLEQAVNGRGATVLIGGDAGIGKTALVEAFAQPASRRGARILAGSSYEQAAAPPLAPWWEIADRLHRDPGGATASTQLLAILAPESPPSRPYMHHIRFDRAAAVFEHLARDRPLLIILEDMHWADGASLDLLRVINRQMASTPALVIATYRHGARAFERIIPLLVREGYVERVDLAPLGSSSIDRLIGQRYRLAEDQQQRLVRFVAEHSQGNPLFALEIIRHLEQERVLLAGSNARVVGDLDQSGVPPLLQEIVRSRMLKLSPEIESRLLVAAVIGPEVRLDVWRSAAGISEAEMIESAGELELSHFVRLAPDGESMRFDHTLVHQTLYDAVQSPRRRKMHQAVAEILEALPGSDPAQVAVHYLRAADPRAVEWLLRAADQAHRAYSWNAAADWLNQADRLLRESEDTRAQGWIKYRIGRLLRHSDPDRARRFLEMAERFGAGVSDEALVAFARFDRGHIEVLKGDYRQGLKRMLDADLLLDGLDLRQFTHEVAARVADAIPEEAALTSGGSIPSIERPSDTRRGTLVQWLVEAGRFDEALELGKPLVDRIGRMVLLDDQRTSSLGDAWFGLARIEGQKGDAGRGTDLLKKALDCYRRIDHHLLVAGVLRVLLAELVIRYQATDVERRREVARLAEDAYRRASGAAETSLIAGFASVECMICDGQWKEARRLLHEMESQTGGIIVWRHRAAALLARLEFERGEIEAAWSHINSVLPGGPHTECGSTTYVRSIELHLLAADIATDAGDLERAGLWLDSLDRWLDWSGARVGRPDALLARARLVATSGDGARAHNLAKLALRQAVNPHQPLALLESHRLLGDLGLAAGDLAGAGEHFEAARKLAAECSMPFETARVALALARYRLAIGKPHRAKLLAEQACQIFEDLGATRWLAASGELAGRIQEDVSRQDPPFGLSGREVEVLRLVAAGMTDAQVAEELHISYRTVTTHLTSIFGKLGVNSRVSATRIAVENELV